MMELYYTVTEDDYVHFSQSHYRNSNRAQSAQNHGFIIGIFVVIAFFIIELYLMMLHRNSENNNVMRYLLIICVFLIVFVKLFARHMSVAQIKKMLRDGKQNDFIGEQRLVLREDGIEGFNASGMGFTKYSAIEKIIRDYDCFFVYMGAVKAYIVPLSAFSGKEEEWRFLEILFDKTGINSTPHQNKQALIWK